MTLAWKDISTRVPRSAYELRHAGLVIVITNAHIDCPGDWLLRAAPLVPDRVLVGVPASEVLAAQHAALDLLILVADDLYRQLARLRDFTS